MVKVPFRRLFKTKLLVVIVIFKMAFKIKLLMVTVLGIKDTRKDISKATCSHLTAKIISIPHLLKRHINTNLKETEDQASFFDIL